MKRRKKSKSQIYLSSGRTPNGVVRVARMPSLPQRQILSRYEKTCVELGFDKRKTRAKVKRLAQAMRDANVRVPTPRESKIQAAIDADKKAKKEFQFFVSKGHPDWAQLNRLGMWIGAENEHPSMRDEYMELVVPRDRVLLALRRAGHKGLSYEELRKVSSRSWLYELKAEGVTLKRFKEGEIWRTVLADEPNSRKEVMQSDVLREIRQKIELLGNPEPLQEACRYAGAMSRMMRFHEGDNKDCALNDFRRVMEDDLLRVAGRHLKRMAYLMAVTWQALKSDQRSQRDLADMFFWRLDQRRRRAIPKK